jgi:Predicted permease
MLNLKNIWNFIKPLAGLIFVGVLAYFFPDIFICFVIAAVLSLMGRPLATFFKKLHFGKWHFPDALAAILTVISFILVIGGFVFLFVPLISKQASMVYGIDTHSVADYFQKPLEDLHKWLIEYNVLKPDMDITSALTAELDKVLNFTKVSAAFDGLVSTASSFFVGVFSVFFLLFFMLRDKDTLKNIIMAVTPEKYEQKTQKVLSETRYLLTRYFLGLMLELACMMTLITVFLLILGIKNALLIGFIGGLMNVIPYLGPLIGGTLGTIFGIISTLSAQQYDMLIPHSLMVIGSFVVANMVDNMVLQPLIYSKSVKAHPVEIFLVIIIAGKIGGVFGMIVAIPAYTVIRIVAKQFWSELKFVDALVKNIDNGDPK